MESFTDEGMFKIDEDTAAEQEGAASLRPRRAHEDQGNKVDEKNADSITGMHS